jgi:hypothetical protein
MGWLGAYRACLILGLADGFGVNRAVTLRNFFTASFLTSYPLHVCKSSATAFSRPPRTLMSVFANVLQWTRDNGLERREEKARELVEMSVFVTH